MIFFALCKCLYFFGTMSRRKISSYFQRETDKIINEAEEKTENKFHKEKNDVRLLNSKPRNFQTKNKTKITFACLCTFFVGLIKAATTLF